ncbi:MAG: hypothetical protein D6723_08550 [Acidobacteria bacterium]|nr:MAG: hypothetical protein D6723_08550 [Acidobacteriota bacterium]
MMKCFYHPAHRAMIQCSACGRPLCPRCDHRIKGFAYCQDCIVRGVELLRSAGRADPERSMGWRPSPVLAFLAALVPGLGAAYNRQHTKAFVYFIVIVGLWELAELTGLALLGGGGGVIYLYSIMDAVRTARAIRTGSDPTQEDLRLRRFLQDHVRTWAGLLIALGLIFLLTDVFQFFSTPLRLARLWPLLLIAGGVYLIVRQWRASQREEPSEPLSVDFRLVTPSLFSPPTGRLPGATDSGERDSPSDRPRGDKR